jgi:hypothetical protein
MNEQRQKNQPEQGMLAFAVESRSDAPKPATKGIETLMVKHRTESLGILAQSFFRPVLGDYVFSRATPGYNS